MKDMECRKKPVKKKSPAAVADSSGNETRSGTEGSPARKEKALKRKRIDSVKYNNNRESTSVAAETHSSSDTDSDGDKDELQFVGGANSDDGSSSDSDASARATLEEVEASFELFDPQDEDAGALLLLLRHSRTYLHFGLQPQQLRELSEVIAGQGNIGSVARATAGEEGRSEAAVGMVTLISVKQYSKTTRPLVDKILSLAQTCGTECAVTELRESGKILSLEESSGRSKTTDADMERRTGRAEANPCIFINCRFTNLPLEVVAEAVQALSEDVKWSLETPEMDEEERPWYRFSHVIGTTLIYRDIKAEDAPKKQKQRFGLDFTPVFAELEQDVLSEGATVAFATPTNQTLRFSSVPSSDDKKKSQDPRKRVSVMQTLQEYLLVYAMPYERFERNQRQVKQRLAVGSAISQ